jgi:hypothetical protein
MLRCRHAILACAAAALMAGCGGPNQTSGLQMLPSSAAHARTQASRSWMAPEAASEDLLYVSNDADSVFVFSYPAGKLVGTLTGFDGPSGLCSDSKGHVFVTNTGVEEIVEYAHGAKKPLQTLTEFGYFPNGCAVDPSTGDLAVANYAKSPSIGPGSIAIYKDAKGTPANYTDPAFGAYFFCGYDDKHNLYVDGVNVGTTQSEFAELPDGAKSLRNIKLKQSIGYPGGVQWNGNELALEDTSTDILYRIKLSGSTGTVVGTTRFKNSRSDLIVQFTIAGHTIVVPFGARRRVARSIGFWSYPAGGAPTKVVGKLGASELVGTAISRAP